MPATVSRTRERSARGAQSPASMPRRPFGATGVEVSALGLGGYHLGLVPSVRDAVRIVHEAIDAGLTFMDNAWEYHDGESERRMGKAIADRREQVFLMTKCCTHGRDGKTAMRQLEESLRRLKTDHLDLWQLHEVVYFNDPERHFAAGGAAEALLRAREQGKVRFIGFTGHKDPVIHLRMLAYEFPFDAVQLPLNCFDGTFRSFEQQVLPELTRRRMAVIGMKSFGGEGTMLKRKVVSAENALRYAMNLPVSTTVSGIDSMRVLRQNLRIASLPRMSAPEMEQLRTRCAEDAADGRFELYKTTGKHEGPVGRREHGFPREDS